MVWSLEVDGQDSAVRHSHTDSCSVVADDPRITFVHILHLMNRVGMAMAMCMALLASFLALIGMFGMRYIRMRNSSFAKYLITALHL